MNNDKNLKPIRITDPTAIKLVHENAPKQRRSLANCAATAIVSVLGKKSQRDNPPGPDFLAKCVCKDKGSEDGSSSENNEQRLQKTA
jgi:hypothetical protein